MFSTETGLICFQHYYYKKLGLHVFNIKKFKALLLKCYNVINTTAAIRNRLSFNSFQILYKLHYQSSYHRKSDKDYERKVKTKHSKVLFILWARFIFENTSVNPYPGHPEFSINPIYFATCAPLFINAVVIIIYRYYR